MNTNDLERLRAVTLAMRNNTVHDYVIPGLSSSLIGGDGKHGRVRMFTQERYHEEPITPHTHRFDFTCLVLKGQVKQVLWKPAPEIPGADPGDPFCRTKLIHHGRFGEYDVEPEINIPFTNYFRYELTYSSGMCYHMKAEEYHTIFFSKGAEVLFFEGPDRLDHSFILEPVSDGRVIRTFKVEPWMFRKEK